MVRANSAKVGTACTPVVHTQSLCSVDVCTGIFYLLRFSEVFSSLFDLFLSISALWVRS